MCAFVHGFSRGTMEFGLCGGLITPTREDDKRHFIAVDRSQRAAVEHIDVRALSLVGNWGLSIPGRRRHCLIKGFKCFEVSEYDKFISNAVNSQPGSLEGIAQTKM